MNNEISEMTQRIILLTRYHFIYETHITISSDRIQ